MVRVALATWVMCSLTSCYTVDYFDCTDISSITTYRMDKACHPRTMEDITTVEYTLLQKRRVKEMKGFSCRVTRSTLTETAARTAIPSWLRPQTLKSASQFHPKRA